MQPLDNFYIGFEIIFNRSFQPVGSILSKKLIKKTINSFDTYEEFERQHAISGPTFRAIVIIY